ncbi:MAG: transglutaminase N-terminal domain-containing protein [Verrucomicrobiota bacterium]
MRYYVTHTTSYRYSHDVSVSHHIARLTPRARANQRCLEHDLRIDPSPALKTQREDYFGNAATFLTVEGAHRELMVEATSLVELTLPSAPSHAESASWETIRDLCREPVTLLARQASEFVYSSPMIQTHADYSRMREGIICCRASDPRSGSGAGTVAFSLTSSLIPRLDFHRNAA